MARFNALAYEQAPLSIVFAFCCWHDSTKPCPRHSPFQVSCGDTSCQNCGSNFLDIAILDAQYTAGCVGVKIIEQLPTKSGRRRALQTTEHMRMTIEDVDMERFVEFDTGKIVYILCFTRLSLWPQS